MKIRTVGVIALLLAVGFTVTPSSANCLAAYLISTWGVNTTGVYNYIHLGPGLDPNTVTIKATFWGGGEFSAFNSGTYSSADWLFPYPLACPDCYYIFANSGDGGVIGCSNTNNLYMQVEALGPDGTYKFFLGGVDAIYANAIPWDYSRLNTEWNMVSLGRLNFACQSVGSNCHVGGVTTPGTVNAMTFTQPSGLSAAYYAGNIPNPVTQWRLLYKYSTSATGTDTTASTGWNVAGTAPIGSPINYSWDDALVPAGNLVYFAGQATFDGATVNPGYVGGSGPQGSTAAFRGGSTLANPHPKFKNIDKEHKK